MRDWSIRSILFRLPVRENRAIIPWATFTEPELAQAGMSEAEAKKSGNAFQHSALAVFGK